MELPRPHEILELADGESARLRIRGWSEGTLRIFPDDWEARIQLELRRGAIDQAEAERRRRDGKEIGGLRIIIPQEDKPVGPLWWDITGTTLIAQLKPYLEQPGYQRKVYLVTARGVAPKKRFSLEVIPGG